MDIRELWQKMLDELETMIPAVGFDTLMETVAPVNITDNKLVLCATNEVTRSLVEKRFLIHIREAMQMVFPMLDEVIVITESEKEIYKSIRVFQQ